MSDKVYVDGEYFDVEPMAISMAVKRLHPDAKLPVKARPGDSGFDLFARLDHEIDIHHEQTEVVPTGIAIELPPGWEAQVRPRSGLASRGLVAILGTVDNGYRGEIGVVLKNQSYDVTHTVFPGEKIAQLCIARVPDVRVVEVEELSETERGAGGFGSTGAR